VAAHPPAATWRKVGVKPAARLALLHAPRAWSADASRSGSVRRRRSATRADVVVAFYGALRDLRDEAASLVDAIADDGLLWVAWPRKAAGHVSDLSDEAVRATMLPLGVVDVKVAQLDEDWSGLKFVWRRERRGSR
jgi:hypothetical protein